MWTRKRDQKSLWDVWETDKSVLKGQVQCNNNEKFEKYVQNSTAKEYLRGLKDSSLYWTCRGFSLGCFCSYGIEKQYL